MEYSEYAYSATTQAAFFKAEAALLRMGDRLLHSPFAKNLKETLLAIDAIFAIRISHDIVLPVVSLISAYDLTDWKYRGDTIRSTHALHADFQFPDEILDAAKQALHYMQTIDWISDVVHDDTTVTIETVLRLHENLTNGLSEENVYHGFRRSFLPHKKGIEPSDIPSAVNELCCFMNTESFSPLGQASVIHHAFERIVPFDSMIDRTGLALAFLAMFKRGLFVNGYMVPICWGTSLNREHRRKLRDSSRDQISTENYESSRESWGLLNARNTYLSVVITDSFLDAAGKLRTRWRSSGVPIPTNSALDKLLDLILGVPVLSTRRAAEVIGKSYGATNEAMGQLVQAGIIREIALDGRERVFICDESVAMITSFVNKLISLSKQAETGATKIENIV